MFSRGAVSFDRSRRAQYIAASVGSAAVFAGSPTLLTTYVALMMAALAASTLSSYGTHERAYIEFCSGHGPISPMPLQEFTLLGFVCHYFNLGRPYSAMQ